MLRTTEERTERQEALKDRNRETWNDEFLTINECALRLKMSRSTAHRLFRREPGVERILSPGSHRPMLRVPRSVFDRVLRRSENPQR